jgi:hypothetical protein
VSGVSSHRIRIGASVRIVQAGRTFTPWFGLAWVVVLVITRGAPT